MEQNYTVQFKVHNIESDAWANNIVLQTPDKDLAIEKYHSELARLWRAADFDFVGVYRVDEAGNTVSEYRDNRASSES